MSQLSTSGWGLNGRIGYPLIISDNVLYEADMTGTPVSHAADRDDQPGLLKLPCEVFLEIFKNINVYDEYEDPGYGSGALALACKKFAAISKQTTVFKTGNLIPAKDGRKRVCLGCGKARPLSRSYWLSSRVRKPLLNDWVSQIL